jgi:flagellar biosynthetic protein FliR
LVIPINGTMPDFSLEVLIRMTSGLITSGVQMSIPIMATLLLSDMTLGLLSRVAPQVQIFFLGIPLKIGLGLVVLSMTLVILLPTISTLLSELAARSLRLLGG